jgi:hypothetical protein
MLPRGPQVSARLDRNSNAVCCGWTTGADVLLRRYSAASSRKYSRPRSVRGQHFLLVSPTDPETAVFGLHVERKVPQ